MSVTKCVMPVAGFGTRMLPGTKSVPKEMYPVVDLPIMHYLAEEAVNAGITDICVVTSRHKRAIEDYFDRSPELEAALERDGKTALLERVRAVSRMARFTFVRQQEPRGTGDALLTARGFAGDDPVLVLYGDDLVTGANASRQMIEAYGTTGCSIMGVVPVGDAQVKNYGIVEVAGEAGAVRPVTRFMEKPQAHETRSRLASIGRFILTPEAFERLETAASEIPGETFNRVREELTAEKRLFARELSGRRYDTGSTLGYLEACLDFGLAREDVAPAYRGMLAERLRD